MKTDMLKKIRITDSFWSHYQELVMDTVIPYQEKILNDEIPDAEKSHALANFRIAAGLEEREFYGMVFQDSDVAKMAGRSGLRVSRTSGSQTGRTGGSGD